MKEVFQTRIGVDDGNCMAACVASIIECDICQVDFAVEESVWFYHWASLLSTMGWKLWHLGFKVESLPNLPTTLDPEFVIVAGMNLGKTCRHACVAKLWTDVNFIEPRKSTTHLEIVHDPFRDAESLSIDDVDQLFMLNKYCI